MVASGCCRRRRAVARHHHLGKHPHRQCFFLRLPFNPAGLQRPLPAQPPHILNPNPVERPSYPSHPPPSPPTLPPTCPQAAQAGVFAGTALSADSEGHTGHVVIVGGGMCLCGDEVALTGAWGIHHRSLTTGPSWSKVDTFYVR